jgi:galactokinase
MPPLLTVWAPGRVNLIGEHTDYSGGLVLPAAIQLGVTVEVHALADAIALTSDLLGEADPFAADGGGPPVRGWGRYGQAVAAELAELGRPAVGLAATVHSSLPAGAGLSSSAAIEVGIGLALCEVVGLELPPLELAAACRRAELRGVGVPVGILDQAACLLGEEGYALLLDCGTLEHRLVAVPAPAVLLVADSGVSRTLAGSAYARRRDELGEAMRAVGAERSTAVATADLDRLGGVLLRRLRHVVTENERVRAFAAALEAGDLPTAGRLLSASHASLRDDYEVSIPELDRLVELAETAGAHGARLVGGGFGGAIVVLADEERADEVARRLERHSPRVLAVRASAGAAVSRSDPRG